MSEMNITQDKSLDVEAMFKQAKAPASNDTTVPEIPSGSAIVKKTPLQMMQERQHKGIVIENNNDDGPKRGGSMTEERTKGVEQTYQDMDELARKAALVGITKKPTSDIEMAELIDKLDTLSIEELEKLNAQNSSIDPKSVVKDDSVIGADLSYDTSFEGDESSIGGDGLFVPRSAIHDKDERTSPKPDNTKEVPNSNGTGTVSVVIEKEALKDGDKSLVEFTEEEREKLVSAKQIELIQINKINVNTGKVRRPDEHFMSEYTTNIHKTIGASALMTFVASRFRANMRGLTFGQYMDLALATEITDVDTLNKKLSIFYDSIVNTSIGSFTSYDDFLRNFAYKDLSLATYCLYIATNPETLELGLECGVEDCKKKFSVGFNPRNLLVTSRLSDRFLEIMETAGSLDGKAAMEYHNESSIITKQIVELPVSKIGIEVGLRSCFDMIHTVLPFINNVKEIVAEKHPEDTNRVREIISFISNYISAIYIKDEFGDYTIREDDIENIVEVIYNLPMSDYEIISAIMDQTDNDYAYSFGVQNITCPSCGNVTAVVPVDIDEEVFRQFQELGSTRIDKKTLPRL